MKEQVVKEWIERGKHDLEIAKILLAEGEYPDVVLFHIHQAVEKYLKGFLIHKGWGLKKIHDLELLVTEAISFDDEFQKYLDFGRKLTAFYYEEQYPPGPITPYSKEEPSVPKFHWTT
jgi:HEPN domain-containing protein